ncbi:protocatechuate 3,4-dioxygenase subunit alpha [Sphaerisporangium rubeum]|uniref:Protocatechuate 3,4-dioxygenase alpha subunit n=1 Tax=Sphaerisporangium rubeum TaxID=321317 RepID=A0A7X0M7H6_9ACTN|nr:protocatechuate 3,4-dioxygenase subunit alpha [Sphaerisporangium rubeum]MBB6472851.1 protocatechuate 3,4-dioxygenase alpha subunit [Sphaerisporangium rubeum]
MTPPTGAPIPGPAPAQNSEPAPAPIHEPAPAPIHEPASVPIHEPASVPIHEPASAPTPAQTIGPFFGYALPFTGGGDVAPAGDAETITLHGRVFDGAGAPVPDALLEFWQPAPDGSRAGAPGSLRRDQVTGAVAGRTGLDFTGFGRVATDAAGHYVLRTLPPGGVPYISVCVHARGLLHHLYTRAYLPHLTDPATEPLLSSLPEARRATLLTVPERERVHRFDVRLQDDGVHEETVFLAFG